MSRRKLTYKLCKEVALKYNHKSELRLNDDSVYVRIIEKKWLELLSHMTKPVNKNIIWTHEKCKEEILKLKYYNELQGTVLYNVIKKNGWVDELTGHLIKVCRKPFTKEEIFEESLRYQTRNDFRVGSPGAYGAARRLNIMGEVTKHMGKSKCEKQYTKEEILNSAKKYNNQKDWYNNEPPIFRCAAGYNKKNSSNEDKEFWNSCVEHMEFIFKPNGWWTLERCKEEAMKYSTKKEFRDKSHAYDVIIKNGWWDELCGHITSNRKRNGYWTYEICKETALKYNDRDELSKKEGACYSIITKSGWLELISHIEKKTTLFNRFIYAFEFPDNHVYVGLTYNLNKRKSDHLTTEKRVSPVVEHMKKTGLNYTFKNVFGEPFPKDVAGEMEKRALQNYTEKGWIPLNKAKPGGLGGMKLLWSLEKIREELKGVKTLSEAKKKIPPHAFYNIRKYGWWDEICSQLIIDVRTIWTLETATKELEKYKTRSEVRNNAYGLYKFISKNNLLHLVPKPQRKFLLKDKYTKEEVYEKCLRFSKCEDIMKSDREYYTCAKNNGWWEDIVELIKKKRGIKSKYSYEECLNTALKYQDKSIFKKENSGMYGVMMKIGWWKEMSKHMKKRPNRVESYTHEMVKQLSVKCTKRGEFKKKYSGAYKYVKRHGLMDELFPIK